IAEIVGAVVLVKGSQAACHHLAQTTVVLGRGVEQFVEGRRVMRACRGESGGSGPVSDKADRSIGVEDGTTYHVFHQGFLSGGGGARKSQDWLALPEGIRGARTWPPITLTSDGPARPWVDCYCIIERVLSQHEADASGARPSKLRSCFYPRERLTVERLNSIRVGKAQMSYNTCLAQAGRIGNLL